MESDIITSNNSKASDNSIAGNVQHKPLVDPKTHMRLLKVIQGNLNQRISCTLSAWPLSSVPAYTAISYTWGSPSDTATILIDGKPKVVRRNCEYVLRQAYAADTDAYYWVDDICIDQSLTEEKNHQVSMMGDLHKRGARVLACVGEHADDSEFLPCQKPVRSIDRTRSDA
ncbi:hypothetical protein EK21DRAFT_109174 [Setomelanomma holmii]|uniref:Heterokaryon incompatibility domain-containing protein n=1 Tax=Setomelanomma holmii TaxID=210430 RepID=A0A9P4HHZ6_9PLEO|nr:hypothetical protein EK21DRAFT_109174 [Setomelanomma holmii]